MITGKHLKQLVAARWRNVQLLAAAEVVKHETDRLMQYAALVALCHAQADDGLKDVLDAAEQALPPSAFAVLQRFADRLVR